MWEHERRGHTRGHLAIAEHQPAVSKGHVHNKMKMQPLSSDSNGNGKSGEMLVSTEHFWNFTTKQRCFLLNN